ncbi:hypothetical protein Zmor_012716 [Zophobas morio]|uniref:Uncharacterized protein n=1 Tax=Zophobas morio TaxID=2755281 RepID=A0AA38MEI2_9CUCU|nr:hypothetical protein Zmor_012716 [Zophobas morio]
MCVLVAKRLNSGRRHPPDNSANPRSLSKWIRHSALNPCFSPKTATVEGVLSGLLPSLKDPREPFRPSRIQNSRNIFLGSSFNAARSVLIVKGALQQAGLHPKYFPHLERVKLLKVINTIEYRK